MSRIRVNNVGDPLGSVNPITITSATASTCSWTSSPAFPSRPFAWPDYAPLTVEPGLTTEEVIWIVGWVPGATTAQILRNPPELNTGTPATHTSKGWVHAPTQHDYRPVATRTYSAQNWT